MPSRLRGIPAPGVLAMTVGLVRSETTRDLRTLTATGASSRNKLTRQMQNRTICAMTRGICHAIEAAQTAGRMLLRSDHDTRRQPHACE